MDGSQLWRSPTLERLWPFGFSSIGAVSPQTAAYVAGYTLKKITGDAAIAHYSGKVPEYVTMSRRPAIGLRWIGRFAGETYRDDTVIHNGKETRPPRYYDKQLKKNEREVFDKIKIQRQRDQYKRLGELQPRRRAARAAVRRASVLIYSKRDLK